MSDDLALIADLPHDGRALGSGDTR